MRPRQARSTGESGIALMMALFVLALVSVLTIVFSDLARDGSSAERLAVQRAQNAELAEGALHSALFQISQSDAATFVGRPGGTITAKIADQELSVRVKDACGFWDLNFGSMAVLQALLIAQFEQRSVDQALSVLETVRGQGLGFVTVSQLASLPGIEPSIVDYLKPRVTVFCRAEDIDPSGATSELIRAAEAVAPGVLRAGPGQVFHLSVEVASAPGTLILAEAAVEFSQDPAYPVQILEWRTSE